MALVNLRDVLSRSECVELCLGDSNRVVKILVRQFRMDDRVTVVFQEGRLDADQEQTARRGGRGFSSSHCSPFLSNHFSASCVVMVGGSEERRGWHGERHEASGKEGLTVESKLRNYVAGTATGSPLSGKTRLAAHEAQGRKNRRVGGFLCALSLPFYPWQKGGPVAATIPKSPSGCRTCRQFPRRFGNGQPPLKRVRPNRSARIRRRSSSNPRLV